MKIGILLTEKCNLACKHCLNKCPSNSEMSMKTFNEIIRAFKKVEYISFSGGEPILNTHFWKIINKVENKKIFFSIISNGILYNKYLPLIKYNYFDKITFSINGSKEVHEKIRGKNTYDKVVEAIKYFSSTRIKTAVSYVVVKEGLHEVEEVIDMLSKIKICELKIGAVISNNVNKSLCLSAEERKNLYWNIPHYSKKYDLFIKPTTSLYSLGGIENCGVYGRISKIYITEQGEVSFCCNIAYPFSIYASIWNENIIEILDKREKITNDIREDRIIKLLTNKLPPIEEHTCEYCNKYFNSYQTDLKELSL